MSKWFRSKNINPSAHKRLTKCNKPFWCDNLLQLWNNVLEAENAFWQLMLLEGEDVYKCLATHKSNLIKNLEKLRENINMTKCVILTT